MGLHGRHERRRRRLVAAISAQDGSDRSTTRTSLARFPERKRRGRNPRGEATGSRSTRGPVIRFVVGMGICFGLFHVLYLTVIAPSAGFAAYLEATAGSCRVLLEWLGEEMTAGGDLIAGHGASLRIDGGCEALHTQAFFAIAVALSPCRPPWRARVPAIALGVVILAGLNLVRILALYYVAAYLPRGFDFVHADLFPVCSILLPVFLWVVWIRRVDRRLTA